MAEISGFFNSHQGDRQYYVSFLAEYFASFVGNGVFFGGNYLKVEPFGGNMDIQILEGKGFINGYYYANKDAPKVITLEPSHLTLPRIDRVVLRLDLRDEKRAVTAEAVIGTPANTPIAPVLCRDNAMYEVSLATVRVNASVSEIKLSNIVDTRLGVECGIVTHLVPNGFTMDSLFNQYSGSLTDRMNEWETQKNWQNKNWQNQMTAQQQTFEGKANNIDAWYSDIRSNIAKLQSFDFDNIAALPGCVRVTVKTGNGFLETIKNTANNKKVAERITIKVSTSYTETINVFMEDGINIMKSFVITTAKTAEGTKETVVGGVVS